MSRNMPTWPSLLLIYPNSSTGSIILFLSSAQYSGCSWLQAKAYQCRFRKVSMVACSMAGCATSGDQQGRMLISSRQHVGCSRIYESPSASNKIPPFFNNYTGNPPLPPRNPPNFPAAVNAAATYGLTTGTFPTNPAIVAMKSPKSTKMPYSSMSKPVNGHFRKMMAMPSRKAAVPFNFWRRAKKARVLRGPIIMVRPMRKRI